MLFNQFWSPISQGTCCSHHSFLFIPTSALFFQAPIICLCTEISIDLHLGSPKNRTWDKNLSRNNLFARQSQETLGPELRSETGRWQSKYRACYPALEDSGALSHGEALGVGTEHISELSQLAGKVAMVFICQLSTHRCLMAACRDKNFPALPVHTVLSCIYCQPEQRLSQAFTA